MKTCPVCDQKASVEEPEWSGGRYYVDCNVCGRFFTNKVVLQELDRLRAQGSKRVVAICQTLQRTDVGRYLNWSNTHNTIFFDWEVEKTPTKREKKSRSRSMRNGSTQVVGRIYQNTSNGEQDPQ
jgi:hypothetical protein